MSFWRKYILQTARERGFTLLESLLVVGLTTLIAVGVVAGLIEGLDSLHEMTDRQSVEYGQQRAMQSFAPDIQAAMWFNHGTSEDEMGTTILNTVADPYALVLGYTGPDGEDVWVRYRVRPGAFSGESYLVRTLASTAGEEGTTMLATGVANITFNYMDADGAFTDQLPDVRRVSMLLSLEIGGATVQREYVVVMRNANQGVKANPFNFDDIESKYFKK